MEDLKDYTEAIEKESLEDFVKRHLQYTELEYLRLRRNQPFHPLVNTYLTQIIRLRMMLETVHGSYEAYQVDWISFTLGLISEVKNLMSRDMNEDQKKAFFEEVQRLANRSVRDFKENLYSRRSRQLDTIRKYTPR